MKHPTTDVVDDGWGGWCFCFFLFCLDTDSLDTVYYLFFHQNHRVESPPPTTNVKFHIISGYSDNYVLTCGFIPFQLIVCQTYEFFRGKLLRMENFCVCFSSFSQRTVPYENPCLPCMNLFVGNQLCFWCLTLWLRDKVLFDATGPTISKQ